MKNFLKIFLYFLPFIYALIRIKNDIIFYLIFLIIWGLLFLYHIIFKKNLSLSIQIGITLLFLDLTFHRINYKLFFSSINLINWEYIPILFIYPFIFLLIRAYKWKYLLTHIKKISLINLYDATIVGFMANSIFPARLGELIRAYILGEKEKISKSTIFATIVLERVSDGLIIGLFTIYIFLFNPINNPFFIKIGEIGIFVYILIIILIILFYKYKNSIINFINKYLKFLKFITRFLDSFYEGLHILNNSKDLIIYLFLSIILWFVTIHYTYLLLHSMDLTIILQHINKNHFYISLLLLVMMALGYSIPSGPGALGPLQASIVFTFIMLDSSLKTDIKRYNILAYFSLYIWLIQILPLILGGIIVLIKDKINLKSLQHNERR